MTANAVAMLSLGASVGALAVFLTVAGPGSVRAQPAEPPLYQIASVDATAFVWRVNVRTGALELCHATNRGDWMHEQARLAGRCAAMPPPSV
jgi:hypothetical protein